MRLASLVSTRVALFKMAFYIHCDVEFWKSLLEKKIPIATRNNDCFKQQKYGMEGGLFIQNSIVCCIFFKCT
jgi:hypothetical protein